LCSSVRWGRMQGGWERVTASRCVVHAAMYGRWVPVRLAKHIMHWVPRNPNACGDAFFAATSIAAGRLSALCATNRTANPFRSVLRGWGACARGRRCVSASGARYAFVSRSEADREGGARTRCHPGPPVDALAPEFGWHLPCGRCSHERTAGPACTCGARTCLQ
jgi:hypothetical protein